MKKLSIRISKKKYCVIRDLKKGYILTHDDITFMRAETLGMAPDKIKIVIGKKLLKDLKAFDPIFEKNIS